MSKPLRRQLISQTHTLQTHIVAVLNPCVEHAVEVILVILHILARTLRADHELCERPVGVVGRPAVQDVTVHVQTAVVACRRVAGLHTHLHSEVEDEVDAELPVLIVEGVDETACPLRVGAAHIGVKAALLLGCERACSVRVELQEFCCCHLLAILGHKQWVAVGVKTGCLVSEECSHRITLASGIGRVLCHGLTHHGVLVVTDVEVGGPVEILGVYVSCAEGNLHTLVVHACPVDGGRCESALKGQHLITDEIRTVTVVIVYRQGHGVTEQRDVETGVHVLSFLPFEVGVRCGLAVYDVFAHSWQDGTLLHDAYKIR